MDAATAVTAAGLAGVAAGAAMREIIRYIVARNGGRNDPPGDWRNTMRAIVNESAGPMNQTLKEIRDAVNELVILERQRQREL